MATDIVGWERRRERAPDDGKFRSRGEHRSRDAAGADGIAAVPGRYVIVPSSVPSSQGRRRTTSGVAAVVDRGRGHDEYDDDDDDDDDIRWYHCHRDYYHCLAGLGGSTKVVR